jgi:hypothetical protein
MYEQNEFISTILGVEYALEMTDVLSALGLLEIASHHETCLSLTNFVRNFLLSDPCY